MRLPYGGYPPYQRHSLTSEAAAGVVVESVPTKREFVFRLIRDAGRLGVTDDQLIVATGWDGSTVRPRRRELQLEKPPRIEDSGRTRRTRSGRHAVIWVAT